MGDLGSGGVAEGRATKMVNKTHQFIVVRYLPTPQLAVCLRLGHAVVKRWVVVGSKVDGGDEKRF